MRRNWIQPVITTVSAVVVIGAVVGAIVYSTNATPQHPTTADQYTGEPQDAILVDGFMWGGTPGVIADALRYCPLNKGITAARQMTPCLTAAALVTLKNGVFSVVTPVDGVVLSSTSIVSTSNSKPYVHITYDLGDYKLFAGVYRQMVGSTWGSWKYTPYPSDLGLGKSGGYLSTGEYQVVLALYTNSDRDIVHDVKVPFTWAEIMRQMFA